jgi:hypothetical protein
MNTALIAANARKHYQQRGGVPCWNPTLAHFYILDRAALRFNVPTFHDWARLARAGRRPRPLDLYTGARITPQAPSRDLYPIERLELSRL